MPGDSLFYSDPGVAGMHFAKMKSSLITRDFMSKNNNKRVWTALVLSLLVGPIVSDDAPNMTLVISSLRPDGDNSALFFTHWPEVSAGKFSFFPLTQTRYDVSFLAYSFSEEKLFFTNRDAENSGIEYFPLQSNMSGTKNTPAIKVAETSLQVGGLAYDWSTGNLYWTDQTNNMILMKPTRVPLHNPFTGSEYHSIIIDEALDSPAQIVVYPQKNYLFWLDNGANPKLERSRLDGSARKTLFNATHKSPHLQVRKPTYLAIDSSTEMVYWLDVDTHGIASCTMDGAVSSRIIHVSNDNTRNTGLAVFEKTFFTVLERAGSAVPVIVGVNSDDRKDEVDHELRLLSKEDVHDLLLIRREDQPITTSPCKYQTCAFACVATGDTATVCLCPRGFLVKGTECEDVGECLNTPCGPGSTCLNTAGGFNCICVAGRTGENCEQEILSTPTSTTVKPAAGTGPVVIGAGIGGGVLLLIVIMIIIIVACRKWSKRPARSAESHSSSRAYLHTSGSSTTMSFDPAPEPFASGRSMSFDNSLMIRQMSFDSSTSGGNDLMAMNVDGKSVPNKYIRSRDFDRAHQVWVKGSNQSEQRKNSGSSAGMGHMVVVVDPHERRGIRPYHGRHHPKPPPSVTSPSEGDYDDIAFEPEPHYQTLNNLG